MPSGLLKGLVKKSGTDSDGDDYYISTGLRSKSENDYFRLFKYISDNVYQVEFSLHFYKKGGKEYAQLGTYQMYDVSPGVNIPGSITTLSYHNHSNTAGSIVIEKGQIGAGTNNYLIPCFQDSKSDYYRARENHAYYPDQYVEHNYVYYPLSKRLYSVTAYGVELIKNVNNSNDFKVKN